MGVRREQPSRELSTHSITLRLPDGSLQTMPVDRARGPASPEICCFCGESIEHSDSEHVRLTARWIDDRQERSQSWDVHHRCLAERMHERVSDTGPFFGE